MSPSLLPKAFCRHIVSCLPRRAPRLALPALHGAASAALCAALADAEETGGVLAICAGPLDLESLARDWTTLSPQWPALTLAPPEAEVSDEEDAAERIAALARLVAPHRDALPRVLLTCIQTLQTPVPDPRAQARASLCLTVGGPLPLEDMPRRLTDGGYKRAQSIVYRRGQFTVRGGILDVWPSDRAEPARIECFGDTVDSLRSFDPASQVSTGRIEELNIPPFRMPDDTATLPIVNLLPEHLCVVWLDPAGIEEHAETCRKAGGKRILDLDTVRDGLSQRLPAREIFCGDPAPAGIPTADLAIGPVPGSLADTGAGGAPPDAMARARDALIDSLRNTDDGHKIFVFADTPGLLEHLSDAFAHSVIELRPGALSGGFSAPGAGLTIISRADLYGSRPRAERRARALEPTGPRIDSAEDIRPGDLVVHVEHGIGRFEGLNEVVVGDERIEALTLAYAEGARLHVPVSQAHLLTRYSGVGGGATRLHRLGGRRWNRERADAERAVHDLAAALLETQALRDTEQGFSFDIDPPWMHAFETSFLYTETHDQTEAIAAIKADMAASRPMDRLVCGDAGYGKTELAMRAAFIAVMQGRQAAVLTPTTVLAEQHYETFRDRMAPYPVRIEVLSRFRPPARRAATLKAMAEGAVDIVIGTHALLRPDIVFRDLGLVVIDEEQRFGVAHKERLKQVRRLVDVLTLTATPIPRTLYLSMTGARDMSLLRTPPRDRQAVETRVVRDNDAVLRQAVLNELNREGQIFVLYNRVLSIGLMARRLERVVPEARVAVAHGQMPARELAATMHDFAAGSFDVLLCTTIVESGLDIPRANTILIHRADRFGIADLYQLRGRVGRGARRAFAYLMLPAQGVADADARERIGALQRHSGLGAGFNLALRDLEIRGAGNLLGAKQSGHIAAVGFGLYCQLLRRCVARLQGKTPPPLVDVALNIAGIDLSPNAPHAGGASLPYDYVEDESLRLAVHRRLAEAATQAEIRTLKRELADRFGPLPTPATRLLRLAELRVAAAARGIRRLELRADGRLYAYREGNPIYDRGRLPRITGQTLDARLAALSRTVRGL